MEHTKTPWTYGGPDFAYLEFTGKAIDKIHTLQAQNARLLALLKDFCFAVELGEPGNTYEKRLSDLAETARAAIAESESTTPTP